MSAPVVPEVAPAAPAAPVTPVAPPAPAAAPELKSVRDVLESIVSRPSVTADAPAAPASEGAAAPQATDIEEVPGEGDSKPEQPAAPEKPAEEQAPETPTEPPLFEAADGSHFKVKGADGKYTTLPDNLGHIEFTVPGKDGEPPKTLVKSAAELVSLGRRAVALDRTVAQKSAEAEDAIASAEAFYTLMQEVLLDETGEAWQKRRDEMLRLSGPEARAERAEKELQAIRQRGAVQAEQASVLEWAQEHVAPALDSAWKSTPDVSDEAKLGKVTLLTNHLLVHGPNGAVVAPKNREEYARLIREEFVPWAKKEQARVAELKAGAERKEALKAQRAAQEKVNTAARGIAPVGAAAPDKPVRPKPQNKEQAIAFIARRPGP